MKRLLFLQIAGTPAAPEDFAENIPLAAGTLASFIKRNMPRRKFSIVLPDHNLTNRWGDAKLIKYILSKKPDYLLLTLYMWNVERSLYIAEAVKMHLPKCLIICGGPEISKDNEWVLKNKSADHFVAGEGEYPLMEILCGNTCVRFVESFKPANLDFSPYLDGTLKMDPKNPVMIETQRGCPFKCTFCFYPKTNQNVRQMKPEILKSVLKLARKNKAKEIIFVDPTFNNYRPFEKLLDILIDMNRDNFFRYNAEIKPHMLKDSEIQKINRAGFKTLEAGLQTTKPETQKKIKCVVPLETFSEKVGKISGNISMRLDLIAGLPGESIKDVGDGLKYLKKRHGKADIFMYHLASLPGTELRRSLPKETFQARPPYFVTNNGKMKQSEFVEVIKLYRKISGFELDALPDISEIYRKRKRLNYFLFTENNCRVTSAFLSRIALFNVIEFRTKNLNEHFKKNILDLVSKATFASPFSTFYFFVNIPVKDKHGLTEEIIAASKLRYDQYINRSRIYLEEGIANLRVVFI